jgi:drug/metabolite transporter (DMT)-like permease
MKRSLRSWSALFACNLMWALQFTCIKLVQDQIGPFSTVFIPMLLAMLFMVPFVYKDVKKKKTKMERSENICITGFAGPVSGAGIAHHRHPAVNRKQRLYH